MENFFKTKRAQGGVFGLSFGMIFSIILIVFFIIVAFIAIRAFLNYQKTTQIGLFFRELQEDVDEAFYASSADFSKNYSLPSGIEYVCFSNMSANPKNYTAKELMIYESIKKSYYTIEDNLYIYAPKKSFSIENTKIKHVDLSKKNPICIQVINNKVMIKFKKSFESPLVEVSE